VRHEARYSKPVPTGGSEREHLEAAARAGNPTAIAALGGPEAPDRPEPLEYLLGYAYELHGRSGLSEMGVAPLTYSTLAEWARFRGVTLEWWEVEVLLRVDAELGHPGKDEPAAEKD
jgi:hypothetical protein